MFSLEELATIITTIATLLYRSVDFCLGLSFVVGQTLVNQLINFASLIVHGFFAVKSAVEIIVEDYLFFVRDIGDWLHIIFKTAWECFCSLIDLILGLFCDLKSLSIRTVDFVTIIGAFILGAVSSVCQFISSTIGIVKNFFVILGSSIWLCLTLIPFFIIYLCNVCYQGALTFIEEAQTAFEFAIEFKTNLLVQIQHWAKSCYIPLDSVYGIIAGTIIIFLLYKNFPLIITFCKYLWTGRFLESKKRTVMQNVPEVEENLGFFDDSLCVICQDQPKQIIILPCKHMCVCSGCLAQLRRHQRLCPICRTAIKRTMKVYV